MNKLSRTGLNKLLWLALLVLLVAAVAYWLLANKEEKQQLATATVTKSDIENLVTATGSLEPSDYVDVGAQVTGQLEHLLVDVGDEVKKGDLLAEIDATVYIAKVDATRAQLRNQNALLEDRHAQLTLAELKYQRAKNLVDERAATKEALETAQAGLRSAKAQIKALEAQIEQTASGLREQEANLKYASIYAPMDGTVVSLSARQGQTLNASQTTPTILQLADLSLMTVKAQVSEADISKLKPNMPVYFTVFGGEGKRWHGELRKIEPSPTVENNVVLYNALFDVPNADGALMTQMTAQVFFIASQAKQVLTLPLSAVKLSEKYSEQGQLATVKLLDENNKVVEKEVVVGINNRVQIEIKQGLQEGDKVLLAPVEQSSANASRPRMGPRMR